MLMPTLREPESGLYVEQRMCELTGPLDPELVDATWQLLAERHAVLRTSVHWEGIERPVQVVHASARIPLTVLDARPGDDRADLVSADATRGFALSQAPLTRVTLVREGPERWFLLWSFHHIILDGWSAAIVLREFFTVYQSLREGRPPRLPQRAPFARFVEACLRFDEDEAARFWRSRLDDFGTATPLPWDGGEPATDHDGRYRRRHVTMPRALSEQVRETARQHRLTPASLYTAAWLMQLRSLTGSDDLVVGAAVSGRSGDVSGLQEMVGLLLNTLPLRIPVGAADTAVSVARRVQDGLRAAEPYEQTALHGLNRRLGRPHAMPLFHSLVVVQNFPFDSGMFSSIGGLTLGEVDFVENTNLPLSMMALPAGRIGQDGLICASYDSRLLSRSTVDRLVDDYQRILGAIGDRPEAPVSELPRPDLPSATTVTPAERLPARARLASALRTLPGVADATVFADPEANGVRLIAYVRPGDDDTPRPETLRRRLVSLLPDYLNPAEIVVTDPVPEDIDAARAVLTRHRRAAAPGDPEHVPRGATEQLVARVWSEVLQLPEPRRSDDFFAVGGDSISVLHVRAKLRQAGRPVSLDTCHRNPVLSDLAAALGTETVPAAPEGSDTAPARTFPLTGTQEEMLREALAGRDDLVYHPASSYEVRIDWSEPHFRDALAALAARHQMLRVSLDLDGGEWRHTTHDHAPVDLQVLDLRHLADHQAKVRADAWWDAERRREFDLGRPGLIRWHAVLLGGGWVRIGFAVHHAIIDGWSESMLLAALWEEYAARRTGRSVPDGPAPGFAPSARRLRSAEVLDPAVSGWRRLLAGVRPQRFSGPRADAGGPCYAIDVDVPESAWRELGEAAARAGHRPRALMLAAHAAAVGDLSADGPGDAPYVPTGVVTHARSGSGDDIAVVGNFLNLVPLVLDRRPADWPELVAALAEAEDAVRPLREAPFPDVRAALGCGPLFQALFNYVHYRNVAAADDSARLRPRAVRTEDPFPHPLIAHFRQDPFVPGRFTLALNVRREFCPPAAAGELGERYLRALHDVAAGVSTPDMIGTRYDQRRR
jgi:aryl carrier-like protein